MLKRFSKNKFFLTAILILVVGSFFVGNFVFADQHSVRGNPLNNTTCTGTELLSPICWINYLLLAVMWFESLIISLLISILSAILGLSQFTNASAVQVGWTLVRDLANMFFVLVVLAIAIGTILRIESYNLKKALPRVVIMAVLVNFSLLIFGLIVDFAQVIMAAFVNSFAANFERDTLIEALGLQNLVITNNQSVINTAVGQSELLLALIFAVLMLLIAVLVIFVMLVVLLLRTIMLWLLAVLSPLPYVLSAFPQGRRYASIWWSEFIKYVIIGPAFAFFLWLSLAVVTGADDIFGDSSVTQKLSNDNETAIFTQGATANNLLSFMIGIGMLLGGLILTQRAGVAGGSFAGNMYGRIRGAGIKAAVAPLKGLRRGASTAEKAFFGATGIGLSPSRVKQGLGRRYAAWEDRMEQQGAGIGASRATDLVTSEGTLGTGAVTRAAGLARLAISSPEDFAQNYLGFRGLKRGFKTVFRGTGKSDFEDFQKEKEEQEKKIASYKRFGEVGSVEERGREELVRQTQESIESDINKGTQSSITTKDSNGNYKTKIVAPQNFERFIENATKDDLKDLGLDNDYSIDSDKKKGIDFAKDEDKEKFKKDFARVHAERMVNEVGKYRDGNTLQDVTASALDQVGNQYYSDKVNNLNRDISRVQTGGITDSQLDSRQNALESINARMLEVLKKIERSQNGTATPDQQEELRELKNRGQELGATVMKDAATGLAHFGKSDSDRSVQEINHSNVTKRTEYEEKEINLESMRDDLAGLQEEARISRLSPVRRKSENQRYKDLADETGKSIEGRDKALKEKYDQAPLPYNALAKLRNSEAEELKKLPRSMEWSEIQSELESAIKLKNVPKVRALIKKAAADGNDNEFLNSFGYTSNFKGMKQFGDEVLKGQLGMQDQEMLHFMGDVGYINESVAHYETSRATTIDKGVARWSTDEEHAAAVSNENLKKATRAFLQNTNRLGFGGENPETGGYEISLSGKLTLAAIGDQELTYRIGRGEFNPSLLSKIAEDTAGLEEMVRKGQLKRSTVDEIVKTASQKTLQANYADLLKEAHS